MGLEEGTATRRPEPQMASDWPPVSRTHHCARLPPFPLTSKTRGLNRIMATKLSSYSTIRQRQYESPMSIPEKLSFFSQGDPSISWQGQ